MGIIPEGKANSPKEQADNLGLSINEFIGCIKSLPDGLFLKKINDWAPRDVTAHLIGWNRYTVEGCQQIMRGETPPFFIDPGDDFSKVNAVLVQEYNSTDRVELIKQIKASAEELKQYILALDPTEWETDYGVSYEGGSVTVRNMVDALIYDYVVHRQQIEKWAKSAKNLDV